MAVTEHHGMEEVPELASLNMADKPDGPAAAAMVAAGIGIFVLGLLTTLAVPWTDLKDFLADFQLGQGVGPLAGVLNRRRAALEELAAEVDHQVGTREIEDRLARYAERDT